MQYNVAQLLKESVGATRSYPVDAEAQITDGTTERVTGELRLLRTDKGIWTSAALEFQKWSVCSRCLSRFRLPVKFSVEEEYLPTVDVNTGEPLRAAERDEGVFTINNHHVLDLREAMRQYEIALTPMKPLCREDCAGLCPVCGASLNEGSCTCATEARDPRWSALSELLPRGAN